MFNTKDRYREIVVFCGAGGNRTRVQTRKQYAFYMIIPRLGFRVKAGSGPPTFTLAS